MYLHINIIIKTFAEKIADLQKKADEAYYINNDTGFSSCLLDN